MEIAPTPLEIRSNRGHWLHTAPLLVCLFGIGEGVMNRTCHRPAIAALILLIYAEHASAAVVYEMDFSVDGQGVTHTDGNFSGSSPALGANWALTFNREDVSSDGSVNEFITAGGVMRVQDWGGLGTVTSNIIPIAEDGTVQISGSGQTLDDGFNASGEGTTWFYTLNEATTMSPLIAGTGDVGHSFTGINVASGDQLAVGFSVDTNGAGDGAEIESLNVDFTASAVPEPSGLLALAASGMGFAGFRLRRRRTQIAGCVGEQLC